MANISCGAYFAKHHTKALDVCLLHKSSLEGLGEQETLRLEEEEMRVLGK